MSDSTHLTKSLSEKLFDEARWKKAISYTNIRTQEQFHKNLAECKKISDNSELILLNKHFKLID